MRLIRVIGSVLGCGLAVVTAGQSESTVPPVRLELGGYYSQADHGFGYWRGAQTQLWIRSNPRFIPIFVFDSQSRPEGTRQSYGVLSYLNWTPNFYTIQGVSAAPNQDRQATLFPKLRYDFKAHWKTPPTRNLVVAVGFTRFDFGNRLRGEIYNLGSIYYRHRWVVEGNLFLNRSRPLERWTASAMVSAMRGREGKQWVGTTLSGGREFYQMTGVPVYEFQFKSYTLVGFYRKWLSRHFGVYVSAEFQHRIGQYHRIGVNSRVFFEF